MQLHLSYFLPVSHFPFSSFLHLSQVYFSLFLMLSQFSFSIFINYSQFPFYLFINPLFLLYFHCSSFCKSLVPFLKRLFKPILKVFNLMIYLINIGIAWRRWTNFYRWEILRLGLDLCPNSFCWNFSVVCASFFFQLNWCRCKWTFFTFTWFSSLMTLHFKYNVLQLSHEMVLIPI
jgi:hypothetical protein